MMNDIIATNSAEYSFEITDYSRRIVEEALYRLMGEVSCKIKEYDGKILLTVFLKHPQSYSAVRELIYDELLDQNLRERIRNETKPYRDLILANAFSNTTLI